MHGNMCGLTSCVGTKAGHPLSLAQSGACLNFFGLLSQHFVVNYIATIIPFWAMTETMVWTEAMPRSRLRPLAMPVYFGTDRAEEYIDALRLLEGMHCCCYVASAA